MSYPAVHVDKRTGKIVKEAPYPRADMQPEVGADPNFEWLLKHTPFTSPDYDGRIWKQKILKTDTEDIVANNQWDMLEPHPVYPDFKAYVTTYSLEKRADEEIIAAIQSVENQNNEELIDYQTKTKLLTITVNALLRKDKKLILTAKEEAALAQLSAFGEQIWKNDAEKEAKVQQVKDGLEPSIDTGWEKKTNA